MSELHIEISELIAAGVNVYDPEETRGLPRHAATSWWCS